MNDEIVKVCKRHGELILTNVYKDKRRIKNQYRCRLCGLDAAKNNYHKNKIRHTENKKKWRTDNIKKYNEYCRKYYHLKNNKNKKRGGEQSKIKAKKRKNNKIENLSDDYVYYTLYRKSKSCSAIDIPKEILDLKRAIILLKRKIKKYKEITCQ